MRPVCRTQRVGASAARGAPRVHAPPGTAAGVELTGTPPRHETLQGKWRPLEKKNHQATECTFPAVNPDGISAGEQAAAALNLRASHERAPSTKLGSAPKAAADGDTALSAASIQKRLAAKLHV